MSSLTSLATRSVQTLAVLRAASLRVEAGANFGDALSFADDVHIEDIYRLTGTAQLSSMRVVLTATPPMQIAPDSDTGTPGAALHLDACLTFLAPDASQVDCLVLVETDPQGNVAGIYALPLMPFAPQQDYTLIGINREIALQKLAARACASFTRGTRISLSTGAQKPVEDLRAGDRILTRDDGPQPLLWIGHQTERAEGGFAPVLIREGTLNNARDLVVSPDHRLFVYQRTDVLGAGRAELAIRAADLVNGTSITRLHGGHVDYFQMLFDGHRVIYAEGIAVESLQLDPARTSLVPSDAALDTDALLPRHRRSGLRAIEVDKHLLDRPNAADALRRASLQ